MIHLGPNSRLDTCSPCKSLSSHPDQTTCTVDWKSQFLANLVRLRSTPLPSLKRPCAVPKWANPCQYTGVSLSPRHTKPSCYSGALFSELWWRNGSSTTFRDTVHHVVLVAVCRSHVSCLQNLAQDLHFKETFQVRPIVYQTIHRAQHILPPPGKVRSTGVVAFLSPSHPPSDIQNQSSNVVRSKRSSSGYQHRSTALDSLYCAIPAGQMV